MTDKDIPDDFGEAAKIEHARSEEDSHHLFQTMLSRELTDAEAQLLATRSRWYHMRKIIRRIVEMLPNIIMALAAAAGKLG